jgi:hypothetical protein
MSNQSDRKEDIKNQWQVTTGFGLEHAISQLY